MIFQLVLYRFPEVNYETKAGALKGYHP